MLACLLSIDLPELKEIKSRNIYLTYLKVLHVMSCTQEFLNFFEPRSSKKGSTVAIIYYTPNFILDPFKEIHFIDHHARIRIDSESEWYGQVDDEGNPDGFGKIITLDSITETIIKKGKMNGYTRRILKSRGEQESGYYVDGLRSGTFLDNNFLTYEVFYKGKSFLRTFDSRHRGEHWVSSYSVYSELSKCTTDILPIIFDCSPTLELNGTVVISYGMFMLGSVIQHLIINNCEGNNVINVVISQCPNLNSIEIKEEVFSKEKSRGAFWVDNCPRLEKIIIDKSSLIYFSNLLLTRECL